MITILFQLFVLNLLSDIFKEQLMKNTYHRNQFQVSGYGLQESTELGNWFWASAGGTTNFQGRTTIIPPPATQSLPIINKVKKHMPDFLAVSISFDLVVLNAGNTGRY